MQSGCRGLQPGLHGGCSLDLQGCSLGCFGAAAVHLVERGAEQRSEARRKDDVVLDHHRRGRRRRLDPPPHAHVRQRAAHLAPLELSVEEAEGGAGQAPAGVGAHAAPLQLFGRELAPVHCVEDAHVGQPCLGGPLQGRGPFGGQARQGDEVGRQRPVRALSKAPPEERQPAPMAKQQPRGGESCSGDDHAFHGRDALCRRTKGMGIQETRSLATSF